MFLSPHTMPTRPLHPRLGGELGRLCESSIPRVEACAGCAAAVDHGFLPAVFLRHLSNVINPALSVFGREGRRHSHNRIYLLCPADPDLQTALVLSMLALYGCPACSGVGLLQAPWLWLFCVWWQPPLRLQL